MSDIHANPKSQLMFAREIHKLSSDLRADQRFLEDAVREVGRTWKDKKFEHFRRTLTQATDELNAFHADAQKFSDYLARKAAAGQRYLDS